MQSIAPQHVFEMDWPLPNVWLGTSVSDQASADLRIPDLLACPAAVRFISAEPLLGSVDIRWSLGHPYTIAGGFLSRGRFAPGAETLRPLDWVIVGGESGPGARPMHPDLARSLRDQCEAAGVAFFFKQWGEWAPDDSFTHLPNETSIHEWFEHPTDPDRVTGHSWRYGKARSGRLLDGREHNDMPGVQG